MCWGHCDLLVLFTKLINYVSVEIRTYCLYSFLTLLPNPWELAGVFIPDLWEA